jgi:hypothetical protein
MDAEKTFHSDRSENSQKHSSRDTNQTWTTADEIDFLHSCLLGGVKIIVEPITWIKRYLLSMDKREWPENMNRHQIELEALWLLQQLKTDMLNPTTCRFSPFYSRAQKKSGKQKGWSLEDLR